MFEKLCKLIAEQFGVDPDSVTADSAGKRAEPRT